MRQISKFTLISGLLSWGLYISGTLLPGSAALAEENDSSRAIQIFTNYGISDEFKLWASKRDFALPSRMRIIPEQDFIPRLGEDDSVVRDLPLNLQWSEQRINTRLEQLPPNYDGFICIDWEAPFPVLNRPYHSHHLPTVEQMVQLIVHIKKILPEAKVGYFGLPLTQYWPIAIELLELGEASKFRVEKYVERMHALAPIFEQSDILFPSAYDFYADHIHGYSRDREVYRALMTASIELAPSKLVVPFVWDRYHDGNSAGGQGFRSIPKSEFKRHLSALLNAEHAEQKINGIVLWGADEWFYSTAFAREGNAFRHNDTRRQRVRTVFNEECASFPAIEQCIEQRKRDTFKYSIQAILEQRP